MRDGQAQVTTVSRARLNRNGCVIFAQHMLFSLNTCYIFMVLQSVSFSFYVTIHNSCFSRRIIYPRHLISGNGECPVSTPQHQIKIRLFLLCMTRPETLYRIYNAGDISLSVHFILAGKDTDSKVHGANMGPTWVLSAPDGPHVGPMNLAIRGALLEPCLVCQHLRDSAMTTVCSSCQWCILFYDD